MKKTIKACIVFTLLIATFTVFAFAANFETKAEDLKTLGLFLGTEDGFELDRAPTRCEAGIMLIRLLGKEEEAKATEATHPFTDVEPWADKYVAYLYDKGLTKGTSETTFGMNDACSAQMFETFVLRALGYSDAEGGDFTYLGASDFADSLGVSAPYLRGETFLRDNVAAISYNALFAKPKNSEADTLLAGLVADKAVSEEAAKPYLALYDTYAAFVKASEGVSAEKALEVKMSGDMTMSAMGQSIPITLDGTMKMIVDDAAAPKALEYAAEVTTSAAGETASVEQYYKDNVVYVRSGEEKFKMAMPLDDMLESVAGMDSVEAQPYYMLKSLTSETVDGKTVYTMEFDPDSTMGAAMDIAGSATGVDLSGSKVKSMKCTVVFDANGKLVSQNVTAEMTVTSEGVAMDMAMDMTIDYVATGESVTITAPADLADYPELPAQE